MHRGEILAFKAESGQHQVFYEDGEDEWVDLAAQHVASWQEPVRGVVTAPGLPEGLSQPLQPYYTRLACAIAMPDNFLNALVVVSRLVYFEHNLVMA